MSATNLRDEDAGEPSTVGRIGRYRLLGLLATGGMAEVYLALSGELSGFRTLVVVKRILPHLSSNRQFIDMFFDEARIAARLEHPNIVRILEVGQDRDEFFLAMEVVQGKPLSALLRRAAKKRSPLSHAQAAFLVAQAANGLGYAHNLLDTDGRPLNVVHRDVSPQNILVSFDGAVKVIDFGVARALGRISETVPGGLKGKIHYMAPEQVTAGEMDRRSDVFALGIVLWEALCGSRLFRRDSELETLRAIVDDTPLRPSALTPISPRLERIVMRALAKNPAERFQSAAEMALALERHAFASPDFSPSQLATRMKALFPAEQLRWRATVAATRDLEGAPDEWKDASGTFVRPEGIHLRTRGRTVSLRRGPPPGTPVLVRPSQEATSAGSSDGEGTLSTAVSWPLVPLPPPRARRLPGLKGVLALGAGTLLAVAVVGAWTELSRRRDTGPTATAATMTRPVAAMAPVISPMRPSVPVEASTTVGPGNEPGGTGSPTPGTGPVPAAPEPLPAPAAAASARGAAISAPGSKESAKRPHRRGGSKRKSRGSASHRKDALDEAPAAAPAPAVAPPRASGADCTVSLGSRPWSEIWIDGKNTKKHSPYSEPIGCGAHEVRFVREDLDLERTITITVRPGEPLKKILRLDQD